MVCCTLQWRVEVGFPTGIPVVEIHTELILATAVRALKEVCNQIRLWPGWPQNILRRTVDPECKQ